ncbi:hypothetical protein [uncultured Lutibacter sp.]|uniref:hypothetical protein n=1 Tax=uncultured Lutibacter sp. TaxID=437739 RepID=UPI002609F17A|nr:hypothetical protein [uncultured Lutibacter sp.]
MDYEVEAYDFTKIIVKEEWGNDNFSIKTIGEIYSNQNNGKLEIKAKTTNNYKLYLNDIEYSFSDEILIENLNAGNYKFCISVPNNCYESCFNLEIKKALTISGKVAVKSNKASISMKTGTAPYSVSINGSFVMNSNLNNFEVDVNPGDKLEVFSSKKCEGFISKQIEKNDKLVVYPNPSSNNISLSFIENNTPYIIYDLLGNVLDLGTYKKLYYRCF